MYIKYHTISENNIDTFNNKINSFSASNQILEITYNTCIIQTVIGNYCNEKAKTVHSVLIKYH